MFDILTLILAVELLRRSPATSPFAKSCEALMLFDYALGGIVSILILAYLVCALARPKKF
jgi:hypothetical protein